MTFTTRRTVYALVRTDIPPVNQAVQLAHACIGAGEQFGGKDCTLVVLQVPDEQTLLKECNALNARNIEHFIFFEPDFPEGHNSACTRPVNCVEREALAHLSLWEIENARNKRRNDLNRYVRDGLFEEAHGKVS